MLKCVAFIAVLGGLTSKMCDDYEPIQQGQQVNF